jgi:uncharacterized membrane protein YeaQ/YmgE (transglycosylase-associated protein family)
MAEGGMLIFQLIIGVVFGFIASAIASGKGRNAVGWFFGGFFLGLIGIIIVACLSNLKAEQAYRRQVEQANHRLREQLRQERMKGEAFRQYSTSRLDAHDGALGMDTRSLGSMLGGAPRGQLPSEPAQDALAKLASDARQPVGTRPAAQQQAGTQPFRDAEAVDPEQQAGSWYFAHEGKSFGPVPTSMILQMFLDGTLHARSLLWSEGMIDWTAACDVEVFRKAVSL